MSISMTKFPGSGAIATEKWDGTSSDDPCLELDRLVSWSFAAVSSRLEVMGDRKSFRVDGFLADVMGDMNKVDYDFLVTGDMNKDGASGIIVGFFVDDGRNKQRQSLCLRICRLVGGRNRRVTSNFRILSNTRKIEVLRINRGTCRGTRPTCCQVLASVRSCRRWRLRGVVWLRA